MKFFMMYGTAWKKERTESLVTQALEKGFVAIDTANQAKHYSENLVGEALKKYFSQGHERKNLFIQTKFTPIGGQDHRLPYDKDAKIPDQVVQSVESSLKQLGVDYLDSLLLHGPYHYPRLGEEDWEAWEALEKVLQQGKTRQIGISNVNQLQLSELLEKASHKPTVVQNRCFAETGWDFHVRKLCQTHSMMYQGFSLLTANPFVTELPEVVEMAETRGVTLAQVVFAFSRQIGMLPLTGTSDVQHMEEDLASRKIELSSKEMELILRCGLEQSN